MSNQLILDFPVLQEDSGDFVDAVSYQVEAHRFADKIEITHTLNGSSYISHLISEGVAQFSVRLIYRGSSERHHESCSATGACATQTIPLKFSYAPEILPSIVLLDDREIAVDDASGLTDFWAKGSRFFIPKYSRIALGPQLFFTDGGVQSLMRLKSDESLGDGEMKVVVKEAVGEGETPVVLVCGEKVYDCLKKVTASNPITASQSMGSAIITQALCAVYAYMQNSQNSNSDQEIGGVLKAHLQMLEEKTGTGWNDGDDFNPSLAATKMRPYVILSNGENHD